MAASDCRDNSTARRPVAPAVALCAWCSAVQHSVQTTTSKYNHNNYCAGPKLPRVLRTSSTVPSTRPKARDRDPCCALRPTSEGARRAFMMEIGTVPVLTMACSRASVATLYDRGFPSRGGEAHLCIMVTSWASFARARSGGSRTIRLFLPSSCTEPRRSPAWGFVHKAQT